MGQLVEILLSLAIISIVTLTVFSASTFILSRLVSNGFYEWMEHSNYDYKFFIAVIKWTFILSMPYFVVSFVHNQLAYAVIIGFYPIVLGDINRDALYKKDKKLQEILSKLMPLRKHMEFLKGFENKPELFYASDKSLFIFKRDRIDTLDWINVETIDACHKGWIIFRITERSGSLVYFNDSVENFTDLMGKIREKFLVIDEDWKEKVEKEEGEWVHLI